MSRWPNFFVAGAPRCGTTSLYAWLPSIQGVFMSRIKEPNFFSRGLIGDRHPMVKPIRREREYLRLFSAAGDAPVIGEATPYYLADPVAPTHISRMLPGAKVLASLRDPVERLYSHYLMMRNNLPAMRGFLDEIEHGLMLQGNRDAAYLDLSIGLYSRQVERFRRDIGPGRFKVIILEEWSLDVPRTLRAISEFLGLKPVLVGVPAPPQRRYSVARGPVVRFLFGNRKLSRATEMLLPFRLRKYIRHAMLMKDAPKPPMDPRAREFLVDYYQDDVQRTAQLLGRSLPWPNFKDQQRSLRAG